MVGVIQALLGTQKPALMALQAKANAWEQDLHQGFIPQSLAWMALYGVIHSTTCWLSPPSLHCKPFPLPHSSTGPSFLTLAQISTTHLPYNMHWQSIMA